MDSLDRSIHPWCHVILYMGIDFPLRCLYQWSELTTSNSQFLLALYKIYPFFPSPFLQFWLATILAISICISDIHSPSCHFNIHQNIIQSPSLQMLEQNYHPKRCDNQKNRTGENHTRTSSKQMIAFLTPSPQQKLISQWKLRHKNGNC